MAISTIGASALDSGVSQLGKNLLINGSMTVNQRGTQAGQGGGNAYTALDRWETRWASSPQSRYTTSLATLSLADSILVGGQRTALEIDVTTAESAVAVDEFQIIVQKIEGQNLQHLKFGNAAAKTLSAQFGIRSPKSGTHCVGFYSPDGNRGYIAEFTVAAANTFEIITIEGIPGDTAGTINNDTGEGLRIAFPLICGSNFQGSAGAWFTGEKYATSNQQNLLDNTANYIYITGVQLEVGSVATDFEYEPYSATLAKCDRYFERIQPTSSYGRFACSGPVSSTTAFFGALTFRRKRTQPSLTFTAAATFALLDGGAAARTVSVIGAGNITPVSAQIDVTTASATTGAGILSRDATDTCYIDVDSEL